MTTTDREQLRMTFDSAARLYHEARPEHRTRPRPGHHARGRRQLRHADDDRCPAFTGAALWFLGEPTAAGMHAGTLPFTATTPGSYQYLCPVPGHAREAMAGTLTVR